MNNSDPISVDRGNVDPLDQLLARSLSARPEAQPISNLADRAMERARMHDHLIEQQRRSLQIHRWRLRIVYGAAAVLIGVTLWLGGNRLLSQRQSMMSTEDSISFTSTSDSITPSTSTYILWLGGLLLISTLAGLATESAISSSRPVSIA